MYEPRRAYPLTCLRWISFRSRASVSRFNASRAQRADRWRQLFSCTKAWARWPCGATGRGRSATRPGAPASFTHGAVTASPTPSATCAAQGRLGPDYMHREALEELPAMLAALHIESPVLLGHSDGATIALLHASRFPVTACVVMAPHVIVEDLSVAVDRAGARCLWVRQPARAAGALPRRCRLRFLAMERHLAQPGVSRFRHPRGVPPHRSAGAGYPGRRTTPTAHCARSRRSRRADRYEQLVLPQCGHSPHRDQPDRTRQRVAQFLADLP